MKLRHNLEISNIEAGLQTVGWLRAGINAESAATAAAQRNVDVTPLGRYAWAEQCHRDCNWDLLR